MFRAVGLQKFCRIVAKEHGHDDVVLRGFDGLKSICFGDHLLVDLFTWADADDWVLTLGTDSHSDIRDAIRRNLGHENLTTLGVIQRMDDEVHPFFECDVKACHLRVRDRQHAGLALLHEEGNHRTS